jgi:ATP-dependent Clp protease, protease subunit
MKQVSNWLSYAPAASAHEPATIQIFDQIGEDWFGGSGLSAKAFSETLQAVGNGPLSIEINSPGGNVWDGLAIYNMLRGRQAPVTTRVIGIAASIASIIALAGDTVEMSEAALMMIHNPAGMVAGTADEMRKMAAALDQHAEILAGVYQKKTGRSTESIRAAMTAETWFTAAQAIAFGLADKTTKQLAVAAKWHPRAVTKTAPAPMVANLERGIRQYEEGLAGDGLEEATVTDARSLIQGEPPTEAKIIKAAAWWARNERFLEAEADTPADVASNLWGGAAGRDWFNALRAQLDLDEESNNTLSAGSTNAPVDGANDAPTPNPHVNIMTEITPVVAAATTAPTASLTAADIAAIVASAVTAALKAQPAVVPPAPAPEPIANTVVANLGNPLINTYRSLQAGAHRRGFLIENHTELQKQMAIHAPQNTNTFASTLVVDYLADAIITVATNRLAMLAGFSRNVGLDNLRPLAVVRVKKFTTGTAAQVDPTNWESNNDSTLAATSITVNQISKNFTVTQAELNSGYSLADLAAGSSEIFASGISDKVTAQMTSALYGSGTVVGTAANFDSSDLPAILALAKDYRSKVLLLDGGYIARLGYSGSTQVAAAGTVAVPNLQYGPLNNGRFGFDLIAEQNRYTGAITNTVGFVCGPDALAIASGLPVGMIPGEFVEQRVVTTQQGLSAMISVWYSRATRSHMASYDIMFGAAAADTTQAEVLISA